eukprot:gnl/MRDRNA2_/MRDRNA2_77781_c0_seq1.p1 gnl/MRDRNA2_/MRDRNA2_77781_c0~~gnl/MRDRNA2_/MRDRNA2_77781_c0_seq1.p1  ORF type:complete len:114 (-),score=9.49 gnl/MRDRNA2_/MRDRNA2_77781_c0_seq1:92-433(-)
MTVVYLLRDANFYVSLGISVYKAPPTLRDLLLGLRALHISRHFTPAFCSLLRAHGSVASTHLQMMGGGFLFEVRIVAVSLEERIPNFLIADLARRMYRMRVGNSSYVLQNGDG